MDLPKSKQIRGMADCDSFYASCEAYLNPKIRGLPICIGKDIVIARSYEAKPYGVKVGTPVREAKKMLPSNAIYLPPRMLEYGRISQMLMKYLRDKCLCVEEFSIDEAFFEISGYAGQFNISYQEIANRMKQDIKRKIGIPVSIGIGPTRLLAKIFSDINKPYGTFVAIDDDSINDILAKLPLGDIPFIGPKTQKKLEYRCTTALDFKLLPYDFVRELLGWNGSKIWFELNSINATSHKPKDKPRAISRSRSFNPDFTKDKNQIRSRLMGNIEKALMQLYDVKMSTKYIKLYFRTKSFSRFDTEKVLQVGVADGSTIISIARSLFDAMPWGSIDIRTTGIILGDLEDALYQQNSLFTPLKKSNSIAKKASDAVIALNKKYGSGIVRVGVLNEKKKTHKNNLTTIVVG